MNAPSISATEFHGEGLIDDGNVVLAIERNGHIYAERIDEGSGACETLMLVGDAWVELVAGHA